MLLSSWLSTACHIHYLLPSSKAVSQYLTVCTPRGSRYLLGVTPADVKLGQLWRNKEEPTQGSG